MLTITYVTDEIADSNTVSMLAKHAPVTVLNFYTMDMEQLSFIAKHRILPATTILFMRGSKVVCRLINEDITPDKLTAVVNKLTC